MTGARVVAAFSDPSTGALLALPFVLSPDVKLQASPLVSRPLDIPLLASSASLVGSARTVRDGATVTIAATIRLSPNRTKLHFVWNRGLLQTLAMLFRPKTTNRYRKYWKSYHHLVGYGCVVVGVVNVFQGFEVMGLGASYWKLGYCMAMATLVGGCVALEVNAWVVFCRRQQEEKLMRREVEDVVVVKDRAAAF
uniref:AIR12 DOMON domain-containing protein n=1 Tax=Oryza brachyantha TaxID=4533 RepID=J3LKX7_ORYBR